MPHRPVAVRSSRKLIEISVDQQNGPEHVMCGDEQVALATRDLLNCFGPCADDFQDKQCGGCRPVAIVERI